MTRHLFRFLSHIALTFSLAFSLLLPSAAPALAETITYPVPDSTLIPNISNAGLWDVVGPSGSDGGKSPGLSGNTIIVNGSLQPPNAYDYSEIRYVIGAVNANDTEAVTGNTVIINNDARVNSQVYGGFVTRPSGGGGGLVTVSENQVFFNDTATINSSANARIIGGMGINGGNPYSLSDGAVLSSGNSVTISSQGHNDVANPEAGHRNVGAYGGWAQADSHAMADGNSATINNGAKMTSITGGYALLNMLESTGVAEATNNTATVDNATVNNLTGGYANSQSTLATIKVASGNTAILDNGTVIYNVYGGRTQDSRNAGGISEASDNTVRIIDSDVGSQVYGGYVQDRGSATATENKVSISDSTTGSVYGGRAAGADSAEAGNNSVAINNSTAGSNVYGGSVASSSGSATATDNFVGISGGAAGANVYGGYADGFDSAAVDSNRVTITDGTVSGNASGGYATGSSGAATAINNIVNITGGTVTGNIYGGYANSASSAATATGNTVNIGGGTAAGNVFGGFAKSKSGSAAATGNTVNISGGTVTRNVYGGYADSNSGDATAINNTVNISGNPVFVNTVLYGGQVNNSGDAFTGNTMNLYSSGLTVAGLQNFQFLNFYVPVALPSGGTMLHVTDTANVDNSTVNVGIDGAHALLEAGDYFVLIDAQQGAANGGGLKGQPVNDKANGQGMQGSTLRYEFDIITTADNQLWALLPGGGPPTCPICPDCPTCPGTPTCPTCPDPPTCQEIPTCPTCPGPSTCPTCPDPPTCQEIPTCPTCPGPSTCPTCPDPPTCQTCPELPTCPDCPDCPTCPIGPKVDPNAESLSKAFLAGVSLLNQGADLIAGWGMDAAVNAAIRADRNPNHGLGIFSAMSGGLSRYSTGSHVRLASLALMAGIAHRASFNVGDLAVGGFFEYGNGSYDTIAEVRGYGNSHYRGGGAISRMDFSNNVYVEASGRAGKLNNSYKNVDLRDFLGNQAKYDVSPAYYGMHAGNGHFWKLSDRGSLDSYVKYFWTRLNGDSTHLSTGERLDFDDVNSRRLRAGARYNYADDKNTSIYVGGAYEYEFEGDARAWTNGLAIGVPTLKGRTGIGEIGLTYKALPVSFDLSLQGYAGKRKGITGVIHVFYEF